MATIGQQLKLSETGWRRYDNTDSRIIYDSTYTWNSSLSSTGMYNSSYKQSNQNGANITFKFYGSKLRIISNYISDKSNNIEIFIDNVSNGTFNEYNSGSQTQTLVYEKINLSSTLHTIKLVNKTVAYLMLDAIDIDDTGYLVHPTLNQVQDINTMQIGDCIPCKYTATTSGQVGYFSELGTCIANEIPLTGTATPDGLFYFIKTDKGTLIADRVIQTGISWDVLNTTSYIEGNLIGLNANLLVSTNSGNGTLLSGTLGSGLCSASFLSTSQYVNRYTTVATSEVPLYTVTKINNITCTSGDASNIGLEIYLYQYNNSAQQIRIYDNGNNYMVKLYKTSTIITIPKKQGITIVMSNNSSNIVYINGTCYPITSYTAGSGYVQAVIQLASRNGSGAVSVDAQFLYTSILIDPNKLLPYKTIIHSLSGGVVYADSNGNPSLTDKNLGAWPSNNEWDSYIMNSDLNGKIVKGDDNIWHYNLFQSWCKETPINGTWNDNLGHTATSSNTYRILRGMINSSSWKNVNWSASTNTSSLSATGFRPVLEYLEPNSKATTLWY